MTDKTSAIAELEAFKELIRRRSRAALFLTGGLTLVYVFYLYLLSTGKELASLPIGDGTLMNLGILTAAIVIISGAVVAGIYTWWANKVVDPLRKEIVAAIDGQEGQTDAD